MTRSNIIIILAALLLVAMVAVPVSGVYSETINVTREGTIARTTDGLFLAMFASAGEAAANNQNPYSNCGEVQATASTTGLMTVGYRCIYTVPTDSLPDNAHLISAQLGVLKYQYYTNMGNIGLEVIDATPSALGGVYTTGDFQATTKTRYGNVTGMNASTLTYIPLNSAFINNVSLTGNTTIMLTSSADALNYNLSENWVTNGYSGCRIGSFLGYIGSSRNPRIDFTYDIPPEAAFSAVPEYGPAPYSVTFTDTTTNQPTTRIWDFGDGNISTIGVTTFSHQYTSPGNYTVSLDASNTAGNDTETKVDYIKVATAPAACPIDLAAMYNVTGDGTDEASKLQSAFDYARTQGACKVTFPQDKVITFGGALNFTENLELDGQNATLKIKDGDTTGQVLLLASHDWWHNLNINGNNLNANPGQTLRIGNWNLIEDSNFWNCTQYPAYSYGTSNWVFRNNWIENSSQYGIATGGGSPAPLSDNITVTGNTIVGSKSVAIKIRGTSNGTISYNKIYNIPGVPVAGYQYGIRFYTDDWPDYYTTVTGNIIDGYGTGGGTWYGLGADATRPCIGCSFVNNSINGTAYGYGGAPLNPITLEGNTFRNASIVGVKIHGVAGHIVANNTIYNGIWLGNGGTQTDNSTITHNIIMSGVSYGGGSGYGQNDGIYNYGKGVNNTISFNTIVVPKIGVNINGSWGVMNYTTISSNVITSGGSCIADAGNFTTINNNTCNGAMDPVIVSFTGVQTVPSVGKKQVVFTDTSTGPTILSRIWTATEIGNGTPVSIGTTSPLTVVFGAGNYSIVLNASASIPANSTAENTYWVNVSGTEGTIIPSFTLSRTHIIIPQGIYANDTSSTDSAIDRWNWSWGDGTANSTTLSATHYYRRMGYFIINLESCNSAGCNQTHRTVSAFFR